MMPDLERIYDLAFFAQWGRHNATYVATAEKVVERLVRIFSPARVVDVGCGCGVYGHFFIKRGVEVVAIDGVLAPREEAFPVPVEIRDLTEPFDNVWGSFDFALCCDVAEHIPEEYAGVFVENLARLSGTVILSAAPPNQGGTHHVNERPKRYWIERMREAGLVYNRTRTGGLVEYFKKEKPGHMWMCQHLSVYERRKG